MTLKCQVAEANISCGWPSLHVETLPEAQTIKCKCELFLFTITVQLEFEG